MTKDMTRAAEPSEMDPRRRDLTVGERRDMESLESLERQVRRSRSH